jgi:phosphatidylglycerophosphate synthase
MIKIVMSDRSMKYEGLSDIKTAIILAPDGDGALPVFGIPAVRRLVLLALRLGMTKISIIGRVEPLRPIISKLLPPGDLYPVEDAEQLTAAAERLLLSDGERVLVMKANHVIDPFSLSRILKTSDRTALSSMGENGENGDEGICVTSPTNLVSVLKRLWSSNGSGPKKIEMAEHWGRNSGVPFLIRKGPNGAKIAEANLTAALSRQTATGDGFLARHVDRSVSRFLSKRLAHTRVTPNQITLAGVAIGLGGAFLLSRPEYGFQLAGSLLFLICVIVDGVDGEVARLKLQETPFGHYLDIVTDNIVHIAIFSGMALGLSRETGDLRYLHILWVLLIGFGFCAVVVYFCILKRGSDGLEQSSKATRMLALLTNRDFAYLIVLCALVHRLNWFFIGAAAGTYLFAVLLWALTLWEKRSMPTKN